MYVVLWATRMRKRDECVRAAVRGGGGFTSLADWVHQFFVLADRHPSTHVLLYPTEPAI